jgi:hypothetical protein
VRQISPADQQNARATLASIAAACVPTQPLRHILAMADAMKPSYDAGAKTHGTLMVLVFAVRVLSPRSMALSYH